MNSNQERENNLSESRDKKLESSELDILRKAYELLLENSDYFFIKLTEAFTIESERRESNLSI